MSDENARRLPRKMNARHRSMRDSNERAYQQEIIREESQLETEQGKSYERGVLLQHGLIYKLYTSGCLGGQEGGKVFERVLWPRC